MNELKLVEEFVAYLRKEKIVNVKEVYDFLKPNTSLVLWFWYEAKAIGYESDKDYFIRSQDDSETGFVCLVTCETACDLLMVSDTDMGLAARKYFVEAAKTYCKLTGAPTFEEVFFGIKREQKGE